MNTPTATADVQSKVTTMFDVEDLSVKSQFFKIHGDQGLYQMQKLENMGYTRAVSNQKNKQYEKDWIAPTIHLGGLLTATANPNEYTTTLGVTAPNLDYYETNVAAPYTTGGRYKFPIQVGWIFTLEINGPKIQVRQYSSVGTACTVTFKHINPAKTLTPANYPAGTELGYDTNAHAEYSDHDESLIGKPLIDYSYTQIIKTVYKVSGTQMATSSYIKEYSDGGKILGYYVVGMDDAEYMHAASIDNALLNGDIATDPDVDSVSLEPKYTTEGIIPYIGRKGHPIPVFPNAFTQQLFNYVDKVIQSEFAPSVYDWMLGIDLDQQKDNNLKIYFDRNDVPYVTRVMKDMVFKGDEGLMAAVGFSSIKMGNRVYNFSRADQFSHPRMLGVNGSKAPGYGICYPIGTKKNQDGNGGLLPYFGMIYRKLGDYSRKAVFGTISGTNRTGGGFQQSKDGDKYFWMSDIGCEHVGGNTMILLTQQS